MMGMRHVYIHERRLSSNSQMNVCPLQPYREPSYIRKRQLMGYKKQQQT